MEFLFCPSAGTRETFKNCQAYQSPDGLDRVTAIFGVASETARDVAQVYAQAPLGSLPPHKFEHYSASHDDFFKSLPDVPTETEALQFSLEVYVDDFIGAAAALSQQELTHILRAVMHGMHDVFPAAEREEDDPNSVKKLKKGNGAWALQKDVLGFEFDGDKRTLLINEGKRDVLLSTLKKWTRLAQRRAEKRKPAHKRNSGGKQPRKARIDFKEFRRVICQLRHAAICAPAGKGLLSESSKLTSRETKFVFIEKGTPLYQELDGWRTLLREATVTPTKCTELV